MTSETSIDEAAHTIEEEFALFDEMRDKIEYIIDLGKALPPMPEAAKSEANRVRGCQSQVWMTADLDPESRKLHLEAESDAVLVKGLIALLLRLYDGRTPEEIMDFRPDLFERIGLGRMLTPGRANGLYSMIARIDSFAKAFATARQG